MEENSIVKYEGGIIKRIGNQIGVTNKLLALSEPLLIPYRKGDKWGFCMADRKMVIDCIYDDASIFSEGLAAVFINEKNRFGFINNAGVLVIPYSYGDVKEFTEGLAAVKNSGKWGYINKNGEIAIPFSFERANRFSCGLAKILVRENEYFIDKKGDIDSPIFDIMYGQNIVADLKSREKVKLMLMSKENRLKALLTINDMRKRSVSARDFIQGKSTVVINGEPGAITKDGDFTKSPSEEGDSEGNVFTDFDEYDITGEFYGGLLNVRSRITRKWGFIDETGKKIIPCLYDDVNYFFKGFAKVKFHSKYGYINKEGEEYWEN